MNSRNIDRGIDRRMLTTPFHPRTSAANLLNDWGPWQAYTTPDAYTDAELEYFAIRNAAGVFDLSPLNVYRVGGADATAFLDRLLVRDVHRLAVGRVMYACWCDGRGKVIEDGTVFRLGRDDYWLCAQEPQLDWLGASAAGFEVAVEESTGELAKLALQGPTSAAVLRAAGFEGVGKLAPFALGSFAASGLELLISRTGYTGDLGYELWIDPAHALPLWDRLFERGEAQGVRAVGSRAYEMARIEAGYIQCGVEYLPANRLVRHDHARSPEELGLGWMVDFAKPNFTGRRALAEEAGSGARWRLARLDVAGNRAACDAALYARKRGGEPAGFVTSAMFSPAVKASIALASVRRPHGAPGTTLYAEIDQRVELHRSRRIEPARVVEGPFWNPHRRSATPPADY